MKLNDLAANLIPGFSLLLLLSFPTIVSAEVFNITVGQEGSFFNPATVSAQEGDIIRFIFSGDYHGVVQAEQYAPCAPMVGGFNSGLSGRRVTDDPSGDPPVWNLHIDDASQPIWFYCPSSEPASHCNRGMVGAINPPSPEAYEDFVSLAKIYPVATSTTAEPSLALSGVGAHATLSPAIIQPTSSLITSSSTLTSQSTSSESSGSILPAETSSSPEESSSSSIPVGIIVGATIGALAAVIIAIVASIFIRRHLKKSRRESKDFFDYQGNNAPPRMTEQQRATSFEQPSTIGSMNQGQTQLQPLFSMP